MGFISFLCSTIQLVLTFNKLRGVFDLSTIQAGVPKERILVSYEPFAKGDQKFKGWSYKIDFIYSDDFFKTKRIGIHKGNKFLLVKDYLFVA